MFDLLTLLVALGTLVVGAVSVWNAVSDARAARFLDRTRGLLELRKIIESRGPLAGEDASSRSLSAHWDLLSGFELEARANAVLYLQATARLARPGSVVTGVALIGYGIFIIVMAFAQLDGSAPTSVTAQVVLWIIFGVFCLAGTAITVWGVRHFARRLASRRIHRLIGRKDDLTVEGLSDMTRLKRLLRNVSLVPRGKK